MGNDNVKQSSMHVNRCRQNISTAEQNFHEALLTVMHGCFIFHWVLKIQSPVLDLFHKDGKLFHWDTYYRVW